MSIHDIINELNDSNSSNHKLAVLKKHANNETLKRVLQMTYDKVKFNYGMTPKTLLDFTPNISGVTGTLENALDVLIENIVSKQVTGHKACQIVANLMSNLPGEDADIILKIIDRNLRINVGRTQINKVWKGLITKPVYMRCGVFNEKTKKKVQKWNAPYSIQLKADGTYREARIEDGKVEFHSRSGEEYSYSHLEDELSTFQNGYMTGELTVVASPENITFLRDKLTASKKKCEDTQKLETVISDAEKAISSGAEFVYPRAIGNGMLNSDDVPQKDIVFDVWDFVSLEEYENAGNRVKNTTRYSSRLATLNILLESRDVKSIRVIENKTVDTIEEAVQQVSKWMQQGLEGGVLKNLDGVFRDGTSLDQLKLKLVIDLEMRVTGFNDGKLGTKREGKVGSLQFVNDEGTITGSCSGFSDSELDDMTDNPGTYLNKVFTVQCNDLTQSSGSDTWSLSHPRFIELRDDKNTTDTLERAFDLKAMAMELS